MSKLEDFTLPDRGFVFWPVGSGDSTTIVVDDEHVVQVDVRQLEASTEEDDPRAPVVDLLQELLPTKDGKPYLAAFILTHPDKDHCQGFADLQEKVSIGEIWLAPRVLSEFDEDLCDDAQVFKDEAQRRINQARRGKTDSGDRVRIIGYADILEEDEYEGFPEEMLTIPGNEITEIDGDECSSGFRAFVHAPFKDDAEAERNDTSIALQVTLKAEGTCCRALLFGDLSNPTVNRIFSISDQPDLEWNVLLAPHHCSKTVMYVPDDDGNDELDSELMSKIEDAGKECRYIVASSEPIPSRNQSGDNPPHARAKNRYEEIVEQGHFVCTQEHPSEEAPEPIVIRVTDSGCDKDSVEESNSLASRGVPAALLGARGDDSPPTTEVGFGAS
jgi:beta-lactamase superfamily II metal-dependent hydrolase